jgi:predicted CxxxxCH...CXXCH cytochrome family protein
VSGICATCHDNVISGTINHYNRANARPGKNALRVPPGDLAFFSTYDANAGPASFSDTALTCSNVSCHGAITTPSWQTGAIDVNNDCEDCHTPGTSLGSPEDNSPYSGLHLFHLGSGVNATCTECHNMANGSTGADNHFAFLDTPQMEGPAAGTFANSTGSVLYDTADQTCTGTCHGQDHVGFPWSGDANHAVPFQASAHTQVSQAGFNSSCSACHDVSPADPSSIPPNCTTCHQEGSPLTLENCASCHGKPPDGSAYPNIAGRHGIHDSLSGVTDLCTTCHSGLDFGTPGHYDRANARAGKDGERTPPGDVNVMATYDGKGGSASFNSTGLTCTNVSCHGGITTPNWQTGTIDVSNDCETCHTLGSSRGIPENNSPFSGRHQKHLQGLGSRVNATCTECHNMVKNSAVITNHFASLSTPQMEGPAADTFENPTGTIVYNAADQTCTGTCHTQQHFSFPWEGSAANHAVPFLDSRHTTVTQGEFESDCDACHNLSPADPGSIPPNCTTCHQSGSPLTLTGCTSCHAEPPDGFSYPNISGRHGPHDDLTGVTGNCATCHTGLESGSLAHYQRANARQGSDGLRVQPGDVNIASSYDARSGGAFFNAGSLTCGDVSCHGGQTTPNWRTGTLNVNSDCLSCHERGNNQFNSYDSGEHGEHENEIPDEFPGITPFCVACHNTANLAAHHFTNLDTPSMEGPASGTIGGGSTLVNSYDPGSGSCLPACHEEENWND